jgi:hypothetical protein
LRLFLSLYGIRSFLAIGADLEGEDAFIGENGGFDVPAFAGVGLGIGVIRV